ncbi:MAG: hypothetical protein CL694_05530 [Chloroflexi bacterium]|nr:hypothetical protein [Chloroflexota bacterium]
MTRFAYAPFAPGLEVAQGSRVPLLTSAWFDRLTTNGWGHAKNEFEELQFFVRLEPVEGPP